MKYFSLYILLCFFSCMPAHREKNNVLKENDIKNNKNFEKINIVDENNFTKLQKKVELISVVDNELENVLKQIVKNNKKDCENTFRFIEVQGDLLIVSEYFLNFLMEDEDKKHYMLVIGDQIIFVQAKKLNTKFFKKLGFYVIVNYAPIQEYEIGDIYDFSYWYIKDGEVIKEQINNVSCD